MSSKRLFLFSLIIIAIFTRFIKLDWGSGFFFHPDENNMASALSQLSWQNFNPHFFAYGQFPLYLGFFLLKIFFLPNTFVNSILVLRAVSAICSVLYLLVLYRLYPHKSFLLLLIFTPGLIQLAHFGTTESLLNLIFALEIFFAIQINKNPNQKINYFLSALFLGIGLATKISAAIFIVPFLVANRKFISLVLVSFFSFIIACLLSPYNLLAFSDFLSSMKYETAVAAGKMSVFYTQQFVGSIPYIFQLTKIFPYSSGIFMLILGLLGLMFLKINKKTLIFIIPCLVYFLYFGQVFTKWSRFMSPLFFVFPLLTSLLISKIKNNYFKTILVIFSILPGIYFLRMYFYPDIRLQASDWINQNIPANATVLSESGNVVNLPLRGNNLNINNFNFYDYQSQDLINQIKQSNYIFVPSRRVFKNNFAPDYYQSLFSGNLGFSQIKKFSPDYDLFLDSENAEETWSVFDHPTIRIFQKHDH